jgi:flagellar hook-basal body complex protein FliE
MKLNICINYIVSNWHSHCSIFCAGNVARLKKRETAMSGIEQSRLLQMRSTILSQNAALQRAAGKEVAGAAPSADALPSFGKTMNDALQAVSMQQAKANALSAAYERGDTHDIVSVMVERQKASLGFEATVQVRNKLLSAYRDIMNMPV